MTNLFLPERFSERVERLMLGIEPVDAQRGGRIAQPISVVIDGNPSAAPGSGAAFVARSADDDWARVLGLPDAVGGLERLPRHDSCRHVLLARPALHGPLAIRLVDRQRRFAPRRIRYPLPASMDTPAPRVRRPALYPGAAYLLGDAATGLRGRVTWHAATTNEQPARWVRVEATIDGVVVGRAHGDDRGEFLLLLDNAAGGLGDLPQPLVATVTVFGPAAPPAVPAGDPFGDLPLEVLAADPDDVSPGTRLPTGYAATAVSRRDVTFTPGRLLAQQPKFFFLDP